MASETTPPALFTHSQAQADRLERARRHAANCILLAVVTSSEIAAELIDSAIDHNRIARTLASADA